MIESELMKPSYTQIIITGTMFGIAAADPHFHPHEAPESVRGPIFERAIIQVSTLGSSSWVDSYSLDR